MVKKHILHVIESLEFGGAEKVVVHLANKLSKTHKISICLTKNKGELVNQLEPQIAVFFLDSGEGNNLKTPFKIAKILKENSIDIIHSHNWSVFLESSIAALLVPNVNLLHTIHGKYANQASNLSGQIKSYIRLSLERILFKRSNKLIAVSDSILKYVNDDIGFKTEKCFTIHNGIADIKTENTPINNEVVKFITVGRLAKIKNQKLMLESFSIAINKHDIRNLSLVFVGDGPEAENLKSIAKDLNINDYVEFLGFRTDVHELLEKSDVFLLSSDYEGVSIALLEAMSLSMSSISTDVGGISETIIDGKTGFLVEQGNAEQYAKAIINIVNAKEKIKKMGQASRKLFLEQFHEDIVIDKYINLYQEGNN